MDNDKKIILLERSLERAAETLGDITDPVIQQYYKNHPEARTSFETHGLGNTVKLEAEMVESVVYCIMNWFDRPEEIRIMFGSTVPHHEHTLNVSADWFGGLVDAAVSTITATIPETETDERTIWQDIQSGLNQVILEAR